MIYYPAYGDSCSMASKLTSFWGTCGVVSPSSLQSDVAKFSSRTGAEWRLPFWAKWMTIRRDPTTYHTRFLPSMGCTLFMRQSSINHALGGSLLNGHQRKDGRNLDSWMTVWSCMTCQAGNPPLTITWGRNKLLSYLSYCIWDLCPGISNQNRLPCGLYSSLIAVEDRKT